MRALPWMLLALSVALFGAALFLLAGTPASQRADSVASGESLTLEGAFLAIMIVITATGALVVSRRPGNTIGWLLMATGVSTGVFEFLFWYGRYGISHPGSLPGNETAASIAHLVDWVGPSTIVLLFALFPTGRPPSPRWRLLVWIWAAWLVSAIVLTALTPGPLFYFPSIENPFGVEGAGFLTEARVQNGASVGWAALQVASVVALATRFRRARGIERQQLKWFLFAATLLVLAFAAAVTETAVSGEEETTAAAVISFFVYAGITALAVSTGLAILRYRLYDIDVVINRTLVYGSVTALLAGAYLGLVLLFQLAFRPVTEGSGLAVALSTLAVAALFRPARNRVQQLVDRRFYRRKYDAQQTLEGFASRLREEIDLDSLRGELTGVVAQTMQPAHVSLWLKEAR